MSDAPSLGVVSHAVGHQPMPLERCLSRIAEAGGRHVVNVLHAPTGQEVVVLKRSLDYLRQLWTATPAEAAA